MWNFTAKVCIQIHGNTTDPKYLAGNLTEMVIGGLLQESHNGRYGIDPIGQMPLVVDMSLHVDEEKHA